MRYDKQTSTMSENLIKTYQIFALTCQSNLAQVTQSSKLLGLLSNKFVFKVSSVSKGWFPWFDNVRSKKPGGS